MRGSCKLFKSTRPGTWTGSPLGPGLAGPGSHPEDKELLMPESIARKVQHLVAADVFRALDVVSPVSELLGPIYCLTHHLHRQRTKRLGLL